MVAICRICLEKNDQVLDIFGEDGQEWNIKNVITKHFWFQIEEDDVESKQICTICWLKIEDFHSFYTRVYEIHHSLNQNPLLFVETENIKLENDDQESVDYNVEVDIHENSPIKVESDTIGLKSEDSDASIADCSDDEDDDFVPPTNKKIKIETKVSKKRNVKKPAVENETKPLKKVSLSSKKSEEEYEEENIKIRKYYSMTCELCDTNFSTFSDVRTHYRTVHSTHGFLKCCGKKLSSRRRVMDHIQWHINPFRCEICGRTFTEQRFLDNHVDNMHHPEKRTFKCDQCTRSFIKSYLLETHRKTFHEQNEVIECKECNRRFTQKVTLYYHMRNIHGTEEYVCEICAKVMKNKMNFEYHMKHKHGDTSGDSTRCQCQICGAWLKTKSIYQKHIKNVHGDPSKKYACSECGRNCPSESALRSHKNYHKRERIHKCEVCDKAYKMEYLLKEHMTTHTGEFLYSCPFCSRALNSSANLYAHKKKMHPVEWAESKNKQ